jgi:DivIVA domain-containing protein
MNSHNTFFEISDKDIDWITKKEQQIAKEDNITANWDNLSIIEKIRYKKFKPTRFSEGYDIDEVDNFLEEVIDILHKNKNACVVCEGARELELAANNLLENINGIRAVRKAR